MSYSKGLEGVIAGETTISHVEGEAGRLSYRGIDIRELVKQDYVDVAALVLFGDQSRAQQLSEQFSGGALSQRERNCLAAIGTEKHPMRMLQAMVPLLDEPGAGTVLDTALDKEVEHGLHIIGKLPTLIATYRQQQLGHADPVFDASAAVLDNYLTMFTGIKPTAKALSVFRTVQILQLEHSYNAGTFTGLVAASTLAPVDSVISAAIGALFGKLHGGADEAALNDAKSVGSPAAAAAFIDALLAKKGKLMGMGHREYRLLDPRAAILKPLARDLCSGTAEEKIYLTLEALEVAFNHRMQEKGKEVWANLEFYKGPVYETLGVPAHFFTATFALSRAVGWLAHFIESRKDNRIIRPKARYVGILPSQG
ncbi:MAG: citrate synthase [Candidatus Azotimanducaceae bacterium]|jgi:citrate synthase